MSLNRDVEDVLLQMRFFGALSLLILGAGCTGLINGSGNKPSELADGGGNAPDGGRILPDGGKILPDGGVEETSPDAGVGIPGVPCDVGLVLQSSCISCHGVTNSATPLTSYARLAELSSEVPEQTVAQRVAARLAAGTMPPAGSPAPSEAEIAAVIAWVEGGAPESSTVCTTEVEPWALNLFSCSPDQPRQEVPLRRLSRVQYVNTVNDLVAASGLAATDQAAVIGELASDFAKLPVDATVEVNGERGGSSRLDQTIQQSQVDASYDLSNRLGAQLTLNTTRIRAVVGTCATDTNTANDTQCLSSFITRFGRLALRRPVSTDERELITSLSGTTPVAPEVIADVIALLTTMPPFLYHIEEGDPTASNPAPLDAWALANRLSYHFWQTMPDNTLRQAANSGALLTEAEYKSQVDRLFADPRTNAALTTFFDEWFMMDTLGPLHFYNGTPAFDSFAGGDAPASDLHEQMKAEIHDLVLTLARSSSAVSSVLTDKRQFARRADLAKLYTAAPWDGISTPVQLPQPERSGLLTRAAFLAAPGGNTRPIQKGLRVRNALLCHEIPPPPPGVDITPPPLAPDLTTREVVEQVTQQPGSTCAGCHTTILNPPGFSTENFDALGRHRTSQTLYGTTGNVTATKPVNTEVIPFVAGVSTPIRDSRDLTEILASSGEFETCFVRKYFRFTFNRAENVTSDGCFLESMQSAALLDVPLGDLLKSAALRNEFKTRSLQ